MISEYKGHLKNHVNRTGSGEPEIREMILFSLLTPLLYSYVGGAWGGRWWGDMYKTEIVDK